MPQILNIFGFIFFFYSHEYKSIHVPLKGKGGEAKIDLELSVKLVKYKNLQTKDLKKALDLAETHREFIITKWHDYFK